MKGGFNTWGILAAAAVLAAACSPDSGGPSDDGGPGGGTSPPVCSSPAISPDGAVSAKAVVVTLSCAEPQGAVIRYEIGADPAEPGDGSSSVESGGTVTVTSSGVRIRAKAAKAGWTDSAVVLSGVYSIEGNPLLFSAEGGTYDFPQMVTLSCTDAEKIFYTTDGSEPAWDPAGTPAGTTKIYSAPLKISSACTLKAAGWASIWPQAKTGSAAYVFASVITCVDAALGDDAAGDGSGEKPYATIAKGLAETAAGRVCVAAGTYTLDSTLEMKEGVSLYGGFRSGNWSDRNRTDRVNPAYKTLVTAQNTVTETMKFDGSSTAVTQTTVLEGFTVEGSGNSYPKAVSCFTNASPVIRYNTINGKSGNDTYGIHISGNCDPLIENNIVNGGQGATLSFGVYMTTSCDPILENNTINGGGSSAATSYAVYLTSGCLGTIRGNDLDGGGGSSSYGVYIHGASDPLVTKNTIRFDSAAGTTTGISFINTNGSSKALSNTVVCGNGSWNYGIRTESPGGHSILNNTIERGSGGTGTVIGLYMYASTSVVNNTVKVNAGSGTGEDAYGLYIEAGSGTYYFNNIIQVEGGNTLYGIHDPTSIAAISYSCIYVNGTDAGRDFSGGTGNHIGNPSLGGTDGLHLTAGTPAAVSGGGTNLHTTYTDLRTDKDGAARPSSGAWAMGAYMP